MPIQFPDQPPPQALALVAADDDDVPASCHNLTYCTVKPKNYPEERFNKMFKDYKPVHQPKLVEDLTNKFGEEGENCAVELSNEPLYKVREKRDQPWRTVIQAPGHDYLQRVRLEKCSNEGAPCFESFCMGGGDFTPVCQQKYYTWEVLVAKGDNESEKIEAKLPGACSCYATKVEFKNRFGADKPNSTGQKKPKKP
ncbi:uncharacterized protein LOC112046257 isoform X2 [Bicyclus anynana]|nr:uncharacterized protein LOC112046257 isoform X2 [Bicyclus anynana]